MKKGYKILGIVLGIILLIVVVIGFTADDYIEGKIAETIEKEVPKHISIDYESMEFSTFKGNLIFKNSEVSFKDPKTDSLVSTIKINDISILDIGYWAYITEKNFIIQKLELNNPVVEHRRLKKDKNANSNDSLQNKEENSSWKNKLKIEELVINDALIKMNDFETNALLLETKKSDFKIHDVLIDSTVGDLIPFKYDSYNGKVDSLFYKVSEYENLKVGHIEILPKDIQFIDLALKTKYDRQSFDRMLKIERDWYDVEIDSMNLNNTDFGKVNDSINRFGSENVTIYQPNINIYRNKLNADESERKAYYSEVLRDLPFELSLDKIALENGYLSYEEKVIAEHAPGKLDFSDFYASIYNFSNTYSNDERTTLDIKTNFMESAPLSVNWTFDYRDKTDAYGFKAELGSINAKQLNEFTNRNLNVKLEGILHKTYFTINGNRNGSHIDIKVNYDEFKIELMNDKLNKPKKLLNAIVNIFVSKDSDQSADDFRTGSADVERNYQGSFYNNLWLNIRSGLRKAITGGANDK